MLIRIRLVAMTHSGRLMGRLERELKNAWISKRQSSKRSKGSGEVKRKYQGTYNICVANHLHLGLKVENLKY